MKFWISAFTALAMVSATFAFGSSGNNLASAAKAVFQLCVALAATVLVIWVTSRLR